jgi:hypothetical protein
LRSSPIVGLGPVGIGLEGLGCTGELDERVGRRRKEVEAKRSQDKIWPC